MSDRTRGILMSVIFIVGLYLVCWAAVVLRDEIWECELCDGEARSAKLAQRD